MVKDFFGRLKFGDHEDKEYLTPTQIGCAVLIVYLYCFKNEPNQRSMKPKRIVLIRHGESEGNVDKIVYSQKPDYALLLTETGKQQATDAGVKLKQVIADESAMFYISPHFRTRMTFEGLAESLPKHQLRYVEEPRLREQEWGHLRSLENCYLVDKKRDEYGTFYYRIPEGESAADVYDRVSDFFGTLYRDFEKPDFSDNVIIVSHGMTIRLFLMRWFHWTVEEFERVANPGNCQILVMEQNKSGKYQLKSELNYRDAKHPHQRPLYLKSKKP